MNNFTKSSGNAYWHAITNLTCCSIDLTKMRMLRTVMVLMLFAFSTSMFAQNRTTFYEVCVADRPEGLTEEQALALFPDVECDGTLSVVKTEDLQGGDCGWVSVYTYTLFCDDEELANEKLIYEGGDLEAPKLEVPADVTVECDAIPEPGTPTATDNCDDDVDITYDGEIRIGDDDCLYQLQRTWTATDNCGLTHTVSQIITVQDTQGPELNKGAKVPTGETGLNLCYNNLPEGPSAEYIAGLFSDNCGEVMVEKEAVFKGDDCMWKGYINYYITDSCGNPADTISLYYNGGDDEAPVFVDPPADIEVTCIDQIPANYALSWTDNCSESDPKSKNIGVDDTTNLGEACEGGVMTRTWTAMDDCGNEVTHTQTITVKPAPPVVFDELADLEISCEELANFEPGTLGYSNGGAGACDINGTVEGVAEDFKENCGSFTVTYTYNDTCNSIVHVQTITVIDDVPPVLTIPEDARVECDSVPAVGDASATDNCDNEVSIKFDGEERVDGNCIDSYTLLRTWSAEDNCGNITTLTQTITVVDETAPELTIPADETVECDAIPALGEASATDNCDTDVLVEFIDEKTEPGDCENSYTIIRVWRATDNCGNETVDSQVITVVDTTAPELTIPANETVECDAVPAVGDASATDNCDADVDIKFDGEVRTDGACEDSYTLERTWTATDNCGNATTLTQTITVIDTTAPELTIPANETVECDAVPAVGDASATDNCDAEVDVDFDGEVRTDGACEDSYTLERTWTATDNCGNVTTLTQTITVVDTTAPEITVPADVTVECDEVPAVGEASATDNCDADIKVDFLKEERIDGDCEDSYRIVRIWIAEDNCGNSVTGSQTITVVDTTAPELTIPADQRAECDEVPAVGDASATDNCDAEVDVVYDGEQRVDGDCEDSYTLIRTWTATDNCGNSTTKSQTITIYDETPPELTIPADETVECDAVPAVGEASATDNCDGDVDIKFDGEVRKDGECEDSYSLERTWTATDNCGNSTTLTQIITVVDTTAPELIVPADETAECDDLPEVGQASATDNCDAEVDVVYDGEQRVDGSCEDSYQLIRSWTATDNCGNSTTLSQTITVVDTTAPELIIPADETVECDSIPEVGQASATDNCDADVDIKFDGEVRKDGDCEDSYSLERTWTATDNCGNETSLTQIITVVDTTAPEITVPADEAVDCAAVPEPGTATGVDNCDTDVEIRYDGEVRTDGDCPGNYTLVRTWTAIDNCGNETSDSQTITVTDTTAPVQIGEIPASENEINGCADDYMDAPLTEEEFALLFEDDCSNVVVDLFSSPVGDDCGWSIIHIYTVSDDCGNLLGDFKVYYSGEDMTNPELVDVPADELISCTDEVPAPANVTATDNCDDDVKADFSERIEEGDCAGNYDIIRTWTATDVCGNSVSATQTIQVRDMEAPVLVGDLPEGSNENDLCAPDTDDELAALGVLTADEFALLYQDDCSGVNVNRVINLDGDDCKWIMWVRYDITDDCGNEAQSVKVWYHGADMTAPTFTAPDDTMIYADANCEYDADPSITGDVDDEADNCSTGLDATYDDKVEDGSCPGEKIITRTWSLVDNCGNAAADQVQTITVKDNTAPVIVEADDEVVECNDNSEAAFEAWLANNGGNTATDNCSDVTWTNDYGTCNQEFTDRLLTSEADFSGNEELVDFEAMSSTPTGEEYAAQGVHFSNSTAFDAFVYGGNGVGLSMVYVDPAEINITFDSKVNRVGFDAASFDFDIDMEVICMHEGNVIATDNLSANQAYSFFGMESELGFDQIILRGPGDPNTYGRFIIDNLRFEGCDTEAPEFGGSNECSDSRTVTFTATDACGNSSETTSTFTIEDTMAPVAPSAPADVDVQCASDVPDSVDLTAADNCDGDITVSPTEDVTPGNCENSFTMVRTWTFVDACGNESSVSQTINVNDTTDPVFVGDLPQDMDVQCDSDVPAPADLKATDNCDGDVTVNVETLPQECSDDGASDCAYDVVYKYTATDKCGNSIEHTQTIHVEDTMAPTFDAEPADIADIGCNDALPTQETLTASDNCGDVNVVATVDDYTEDACGGYAVTYRWTVTDACGNSDFRTKTFNVLGDQEAPMITCPADMDFGTVESTPISLFSEDATATDDCDDDVTVTFTDVYGDPVYVPGGGDENSDPAAVYKFTCQTGPNNFDFVTFTHDGTFSPSDIGLDKANYTPDDAHEGWELKFVVGIDRPDGNTDANDWVLYNNLGEVLSVKNSQNNEPAFPDCNANWQETELLEDPIPDGYGCKIIRVECLGQEVGPGVTYYNMVRTFTATDDCGKETTCTTEYFWNIVDLPTGANDETSEGESMAMELDFTAYPVPFDRDVNVKFNFEFDTDVIINIHDTRGLLVKSLTLNNVRANSEVTKSFDLSRAGDQLFYITVTTNQGSVTKKVVSSNMKIRR